MPSSEFILAGLTSLSNDWQLIAIGFHLYFVILIIVTIAGVTLSRKIAGFLLAVPPLSVSILAWSGMNLFNGFVFAIITILLVIYSMCLPMDRIYFSSTGFMIIGIIMLAFGWVYPHFLNTRSFIPYLYAAPLGIVPCPTLCAIIGCTLIIGGLGSRSWSIVLGTAGIFYGIFGTLRLGVALDWVLVAGAITLVGYALFFLKVPDSK